MKLESLCKIEAVFGIYVLSMLKVLAWAVGAGLEKDTMGDYDYLARFMPVAVPIAVMVVVAVMGLMNMLLWESPLIGLIAMLIVTAHNVILIMQWYQTVGWHSRIFVRGIEVLVYMWVIMVLQTELFKRKSIEGRGERPPFW